MVRSIMIKGKDSLFLSLPAQSCNLITKERTYEHARAYYLARTSRTINRPSPGASTPGYRASYQTYYSPALGSGRFQTTHRKYSPVDQIYPHRHLPTLPAFAPPRFPRAA